jgi:hypothetical protein
VFRLLPILLVLLLAGCASKPPETDSDISARDDAKCQSSGVKPGTPEYEKCRTKLADLRAQQELDDRKALAARLQGKLPSQTGQ